MIKGMMIHENLANYYDFMGLKGYKKCHEYHFMSETCGFRKLNKYFINHHNYLIPDVDIETPQVIPESWYRVSRLEVDAPTKKSAVKNGLTMWHTWERETKKLYERMYKELLALDEVASAMFIKCYVHDVDDELKCVEKYMLNKQTVDFDLNMIISEQDDFKHKYKCKLERLMSD